MKTFWKRALSVSAAVSLVIGALAGCRGKDSPMAGSGEGSGTDSGAAGQAMGRYIEEETALPEGMALVLDMVKMTDGKVRILGMEESGSYALWDSADSGESWEKAGNLPEDMFGENGTFLGEAVLSPTGEGFLCSYEEDGSMGYYHMTAQMQTEEVKLELGELDLEEESGESDQTEGEEETEVKVDTAEPGEVEVSEDEQGEIFYKSYEMDMSNGLRSIHYSSEGVLFANDYNNKLYQIDPETGALEEIASEVQEFEIVGDMVIAEDVSSAVVLYNAKTGETAAQDTILADVIKEQGGMTSFVAGVKKILFQEGEEDSVYYCNVQGVYRHVFGGTVNEQLIDGNLNSLGSPDAGLAAMCAADDGAFLVLISQSDGSNKLLKYMYSKDTPSRPSKELKLYALEDSMEIRQAISMFQKENADYYINFEVGLGGDDGVTVSDALKTLNAEIMAGKGPDILVLDGMPVQSYMEKGLLADLTGIYQELKEGDGCFEQIAETYGTERGVCAIPSRFTIPMIEGSQEILDSSGDLRTFADKIEELRKEDADIRGIVESSSPELLAEKIYQSYSPALVGEDGSLDEEKAAEFYTQLKRIYDTGNYSQETVENVSYSIQWAGVSAWTDLGMGVMGLLGGDKKANMGTLGDMSGFNQMISANEKAGLTYDLLSLAGKKVYCPEAIIGISSKSAQTEEAGKFVSYILSKEVQAMNQGGGFPVNKKAYEEAAADKGDGKSVMGYTVSDKNTGEVVSLEVKWAAQEELDGLRGKIDSLDTPCLTDSVIGETVREQAVKCLTGECTVEEAVESLVQKVNLYMAE